MARHKREHEETVTRNEADLAVEASKSPTKITNGLLGSLLIFDEGKPHESLATWAETHTRRDGNVRFFDEE